MKKKNLIEKTFLLWTVILLFLMKIIKPLCELNSKQVSIAVEGLDLHENTSDEETEEKRKKFLEKRKTFEYHEYPRNKIPEEIEDETLPIPTASFLGFLRNLN